MTGDDSHYLMIALSFKLLNPRVRVLVRLHDIRNANKARKAGTDEIVGDAAELCHGERERYRAEVT